VVVHGATIGGRPAVTWLAALVAASGDATATAMEMATAMGMATAGGPPGQIPGGIRTAIFAGTVATLSAAAFAVPFLAVWAAGTGVRLRRQRVLAMERDALAEAVSRAVRAAHDERARTAAGLRSAVLGHIERMAEAGELAEVVTHARAALGAMRSLLAVLGAGAAPIGLAPTPALAGIEALCAAYRAAGGDVTLTGVTGQRPLPAEVDVTAYRIIEAALARGDGGPDLRTPG
jgi:signal transduction histidine kinase